MAILNSSVETGKSWMTESLALFKAEPSKWMMLASAYVTIFMMLPQLLDSQIFSMMTILIWPFFMVIAIALYKNVDKKIPQTLSDVFDSVKPKLQALLALGGVMLLYGVLVGFLLNSDLERLVNLSKNVEGMTNNQVMMLLNAALPFLLKLLLALIPIMMATWFSPMLIAFNDYPVMKAIKSSIAGSLQYMVAMTITWILMTFAIFALLMIAGIFMALISGLLPALGLLLMPAVVLGSLLLATSLMLAFQYVSYRDVFRAASIS